MKNQKNIFLAFLKGIAAAVILTGIGIALLALFVKTIDLASPLISGAAIVIKAISVIVGTVLVCRSIRKKGAVCGGITALIYWGICFGLAALSGAGASFTIYTALDMALTALAEVFSGIIAVNLLK